MDLIPGAIDVTNNYLEYPEIVVDRIERFTEALGDRSRTIASTGCGLSTLAGYVMVAEDVAWEKLRIMSEGTRVPSPRCAQVPFPLIVSVTPAAGLPGAMIVTGSAST